MKLIILSLTITLLIGSCTKEHNNTNRLYFRLKVNGKNESLNKCQGFLSGGTGGGEFSCEIIGDSILFLNVGCDTKAGFYLKQTINNGIYQLDNRNQAWYGNYSLKLYQTTAIHKGTLTIEKSTFQSVEVIKTIKGKFSFTAIDTASGQTQNITNGEFLMERSHY